MTDEDLEKVARAATPGPWTQKHGLEADWYAEDWVRAADGTYVAICRRAPDGPSDNAEFIAAFNPATALALLERVRKAEANAKRRNEDCEEWKQNAKEYARRAETAEARVEELEEAAEERRQEAMDRDLYD